MLCALNLSYLTCPRGPIRWAPLRWNFIGPTGLKSRCQLLEAATCRGWCPPPIVTPAFAFITTSPVSFLLSPLCLPHTNLVTTWRPPQTTQDSPRISTALTHLQSPFHHGGDTVFNMHPSLPRPRSSSSPWFHFLLPPVYLPDIPSLDPFKFFPSSALKVCRDNVFPTALPFSISFLK